MNLDLEDMGALALRAALAAGEVIAHSRDNSSSIASTAKGPADYVTATDRAAEAVILDLLKSHSPSLPILSEEAGGQHSLEGPLWVVDPLDGTTNYVHALPTVGVSIGLLIDGVPSVGVVNAPYLGHYWQATRGQGAYDDTGTRLQVAPPRQTGTLVATGFPFRLPQRRTRYVQTFERALDEYEDMRRMGAASLDLAYTAAGAYDGYFEMGLSLWDLAAGALLIQEAGGVVSDWSGDLDGWKTSGDVIAGAPAWHVALVEMVARDGAPQ